MIICRREVYVLDSEPKVRDAFRKMKEEGAFVPLQMQKSFFVEITDIVEMMRKSKDKESHKLADKIAYLSEDAILEVKK